VLFWYEIFTVYQNYRGGGGGGGGGSVEKRQLSEHSLSYQI
jgi:hypothetical protein